jgi:PAS domain S-box-containing protein
VAELSGYAFSPLRVGDFALYRGRGDGLAPILLVAAQDASPWCLKRLEHEYALKAELDAAWAAAPIALSNHDDRMSLVLEDPGGEPLDRLLGQPLDTTQFLRIAIAITAALRRVHERGLIHKDIKPANLLVDASSGGAWLTGFGIASRLPREHRVPEPPEVIAGTLAYMAPEQTGRMNRSVDPRSDLYALGVTFYEMLAGTLPFRATDPMEWVHCHIARQADPPDERAKHIPKPLSSIVMKLLAKIAEDRYQTAAGVEADLRRCLMEWEARRHIAAFPLGVRDLSDRLLIPERLYGREAEINTLLAAFDRVVAQGATELVLVSGYSGIGKSALVNELHKALVPPRGLFASGKFDQYKRDIPYATLAQAFRTLVRSILGQSEAALSRWREGLREALGPNGALIVNLVPELELIIGKQPPVAELPPQDAKNRFQIVFRRFIGVFARKEHPLALFLDDLQWLDTATLDLLEHLVTHSEVQHLLLVGAYRDNEVDPAHPLMRTLEAIRKAGASVQEIVLAPLGLDDIGRLLADTLHCETKGAWALAQLVHEKTSGNPFFAIQFLIALTEEDLLRFDHVTATWTWDLPRIRSKGFTDNVVDLMAAKLARLTPACQSALAQLACFGNSVDIATIIVVHGGTEEEIDRALDEALGSGLVFRANRGFKFLHDRVQEAAYGPMPGARKVAEHLLIGRALAARMAETGIEDAIFDVANHFNRGAELITTQEERERVFEVNLMAGKRARRSTAYAAARNYLAEAAAMLPPDAWMRRYDETFDLYLTFSECEYLVGNFAAADTLFGMILDKAASDIDRAKVHGLRIKLYQVAGKYDEGLAVALDVLRDFGLTFPDTDSGIQAAVEAQFREIPINLGERRIGELLDAPVAADPKMRTIIDLLVDAAPCAYIGRPTIFPLIALEAVNRSMRYGNTDQSSFAYAIFAIMLVAVVGDIDSAFQYSEMSLKLNEKLNNPRLRGTLLHLHGDHINFWRRHIATGLPILEKAFSACLEVGDLVYAGFLAFETVWQLFEKGDVLAEVVAQSAKYAAFARQSHNDAVYETIRLEQQFVASLQGRTTDLQSFDDDTFDEAACFAVIVKATFGCGIVFYHIMKQMLAFLYGRHAQALDSAARAEPVLGAAMGMPIEATYHFFHALTLTALYPTATAAQQDDYRRLLEEKLKKLKLWADNCPENYRNRHALVSAEAARIEGRDFDAMRLYEEAIRSARDHGFVQNEALANELAARFYAARGLETIADVYFRNARSCYRRWGAEGKVRQLEQLHPHLRERPTVTPPTATLGEHVEQLEVGTIVKASQALSGEIVLGKLIEILMRIAVEHAGAERGLLILFRGDEPRIEAEAATGSGGVEVTLLQAEVTSVELPESVLHYAIRTRESVILDDAAANNPFSADEYIRQRYARSVLCLPLVKQTGLIGVLYLENSLASHVFTPARTSLLKLLASQAAISLENARLYADLINENRDRRKVEEALRESEQRFRDHAETTSDWLWETGPDHRFTWASEKLAAAGVDAAQRIGATRWDMAIAVEEEREKWRLHVATLEAHKPFRDFKYRTTREDGSVLHVATSGTPFFDPEGRFLGYRGGSSDITPAVRAEDALQQAQAELAHVARLTTIGELTASITHEIVQPLSAVVTNGNTCLHWLDDKTIDLAKARSAAERMVRDAERTNDIIRRIRALMIRSKTQKLVVDMNGVVRDVVALTHDEFLKRQVSVSAELTEALPPVLGDRVQLQQLVLNLIMNGIEAMASVAGRPKELIIETRAEGTDHVLTVVRDSGAGLDPNKTDEIFKPFFTTKSEGTGMGLAIGRSIVEAHDGRIWASPGTPYGAAFYFALPTTAIANS